MRAELSPAGLLCCVSVMGASRIAREGHCCELELGSKTPTSSVPEGGKRCDNRLISSSAADKLQSSFDGVQSIRMRAFLVLKVRLLEAPPPFRYQRICFNKRKQLDKFEP